MVSIAKAPYIPKNPSLPTFQVDIDGKSLEPKTPEHCISFEYSFAGDGGSSTFTMTLFDESWLDIETKFREASRANKLKVRWGYPNGSENGYKEWSKWHSISVTDFQPTYSTHGMVLTITGVANELNSSAGSVKINATYPDKTVSEVVSAICDRNGWQKKIATTDAILSYDGATSKEKVKKTWVQNCTDLYFIKRILLPKAVSSTRAGFQCYLDETTSPSTLYFRPPPFEEPSQTQYLVMRDQMGVVKSFSPQIPQLSLFNQAGGPTTTAIYIDPYRRKSGKVQVNNQTIQTSTSSQNNDKLVNIGKSTTAPTELPPGAVEKIIYTTAKSEEETKAQAEQGFNYLYDMTYNATLEIVGDPTKDKSSMHQNVDVILTLSDGKLYYLSGKFGIMGFSHNISAGEYTTTLSLTKNAGLEGEVRPSGSRPSN